MSANQKIVEILPMMDSIYRRLVNEPGRPGWILRGYCRYEQLLRAERNVSRIWETAAAMGPKSEVCELS